MYLNSLLPPRLTLVAQGKLFYWTTVSSPPPQLVSGRLAQESIAAVTFVYTVLFSFSFISMCPFPVPGHASAWRHCGPVCRSLPCFTCRTAEEQVFEPNRNNAAPFQAVPGGNMPIVSAARQRGAASHLAHTASVKSEMSDCLNIGKTGICTTQLPPW